MKVLAITRHPAAQNWIAKRIQGAEIVATTHYQAGQEAGFDLVVGILPINLVADLNEKGVAFQMLTMDNIPEDLRGKELTEEQMDSLNAKLEGFAVTRT